MKGEKEEGPKSTDGLLPRLWLRVRRRSTDMYAIIPSTRNVTPPRIQPVMGPRAMMSMRVEFVGMQ